MVPSIIAAPVFSWLAVIHFIITFGFFFGAGQLLPTGLWRLRPWAQRAQVRLSHARFRVGQFLIRCWRGQL